MGLLEYCIFGITQRIFPNYRFIDATNIRMVNTSYGQFHYSTPLKMYTDLFEQIEYYKISDVKKEDVILDIGANVGAFTVKVAHLCKKIYAVEPLFFPELRDNIELNSLDNVSVFPYALGPSGIVSFCGRSAQMEGASLSRILQICNPKPTFLKIDCEGGEWSILPEELAGFRAIEGEIHPAKGHKVLDFVEMLEEIGFSCIYEREGKGLNVHARR